MTGTGRRPLRKDAARNRQRLLDAASGLFATRGLGVTLNDIAHHAGVGVGTAYRRFSNKEAVVDALFEIRMQEVADAAQVALEQPDAWGSLVDFLERSLTMQFGDVGLTEIMNDPSLGQERVKDARDRLAPPLERVVDRAKDQGVIRPDFDQSDLISIQVALSAIMDRSREVAPDLYRRYLVMFLDGVRTDRATTAFPVDALDANQTHAAMTSRRHQAGGQHP